MNALLMQANADLSLRTSRLSGLPELRDYCFKSVHGVKALPRRRLTPIRGGIPWYDHRLQSAERPSLSAAIPYFGVAPLPQLNKTPPLFRQVLRLAVSSKSPYRLWLGICFLCDHNVGAAEDYLTASGRPPALRSLYRHT
jgi:hypothetical protein